jgi:DNA-binding transcriptional MocR family regulator
MQLLLPLADEVDDVAIADAAARRGIGLGALSPLHLARNPERGLLLGYGRLLETRINEAVDALSSILIDADAAHPPRSSPARCE